MEFNDIKKAVFKILNDDTILVQLKHPKTNKLLEDDNGFSEIEIYSRNSSIVRRYLVLESKNAYYSGARTLETAREANIKFFSYITRSVRNISINGVVITKENLDMIYGDEGLAWVTEQLTLAFESGK